MQILVVGAGFAGATIARELAEAGHKVEVIDKRPHIAGNCFDYINQHGIRIHKYGPHLFHTNNLEVVNWLSRFTEWLEYKHKVKAMLASGDLVPLPVNRKTLEYVARSEVLDVFYRPYTLKMWARPLEELDPSIINRVPIREDDVDLYFPNDVFQAVPKTGYTALFKKIFTHPNIQLRLNEPFQKQMEDGFDHVFNSMPIDEYYDFCFGKLPYRSIKFHHVDLPAPRLFPVVTVNFTHSGPFTRITEWKNLPGHGLNSSVTSLTYEEPCGFEDNSLERYYPVKDVDGKNRELYKKYASIENKKTTFIGRCGMYVYLDMHQVISASLSIARSFI